MDFSIGDLNGAEGIHNFNKFLVEDEFGANPESKGRSCQNNADENFEARLQHIGKYEETVGGKKRDQRKGNTRPNKVAFGPKSFVHSLIIAGEIK